MTLKHLFPVAAALAVAFFLPGQKAVAQTVESRVKADSLKIGDVITYTLIIKRDREYDQVLLPDTTHFAPDFEIRDKRMFRPTPFADSVVYELQFFGTKDSFVPNVPVGFVSKTDTSYVLAEKAPFAFKSELKGEEESAEFKPLKPIYAFARAWWPFILGGVLAALIAWLGFRWYKKRKSAPKPPPAPLFFERFDNPLTRLGNELKAVRDSNALATGQFKEVYSELGDAIRRYFERVYRFPALEQTTGEVIRDLRRNAIDVRIVDLTNKILRAADMVKFAKFEPGFDSAYTTIEHAEDLLKILREVDGPAIQRMQVEFEAAQVPAGEAKP
jgi:flavodoxin